MIKVFNSYIKGLGFNSISIHDHRKIIYIYIIMKLHQLRQVKNLFKNLSWCKVNIQNNKKLLCTPYMIYQ